jgi:AbrB family looped-hinge helix DNA binding protein
MKAVVAERGQVTIPKRLRDRLGIKAGTVMEFTEEGGKLVATKATSADPIERVYGCLGPSKPTDTIMTELRGKP